MEKLDLKKEYKSYYTAQQFPELIESDESNYITIEGRGEPGGEQFTSRVNTLYPVAYGIKKICKTEGRDFGVPSLEGLWWTDNGKTALETDRKDWLWKLMIRMPDYANKSYLDNAVRDVIQKKKLLEASFVKWEIFSRHKYVKIMHVGPYSTEEEPLGKMREFIKKNNLKSDGHHHEVYLSDPRKVSPDKIKTILLQSVK